MAVARTSIRLPLPGPPTICAPSSSPDPRSLMQLDRDVLRARVVAGPGRRLDGLGAVVEAGLPRPGWCTARCGRPPGPRPWSAPSPGRRRTGPAGRRSPSPRPGPACWRACPARRAMRLAGDPVERLRAVAGGEHLGVRAAALACGRRRSPRSSPSCSPASRGQRHLRAHAEARGRRGRRRSVPRRCAPPRTAPSASTSISRTGWSVWTSMPMSPMAVQTRSPMSSSSCAMAAGRPGRR